MNIGGGEAADQLVRMMLSGSEVAVRLGGSALKNMLALTMALAKHNKTISGKINLGKMLRETRDLRQFPMTPEQYRQFSKLAKKQKILFSAIRDKDGTGKLIDVILPVTELDRANMIFERVGYLSPDPAAPQREQKPPREERERPQKQREEKGKEVAPPERKAPQKAPKEPVRPQEKGRQEAAASKKDSPSQRASPGTRSSSSSRSKAGPTARTSDRPSVEGRLKAYRGELDRRRKSVPVKSKAKTRPKQR
nr:DUF3801 domain-containing protein [uncultured Oscillibacter sp.]